MGYVTPHMLESMLWNCLIFKRKWWSKKFNQDWRRKSWKRSRSRKFYDDRQEWAVDSPANRTQKRRNMAQIFDRRQALPTGLLTGTQDCRQPEAQNWIKISFLSAFRFLLWWLRIELKFYLLKDAFLKIEGSKIVLDQENQLLQKLIKFFKHLRPRSSYSSNRVCIIKL